MTLTPADHLIAAVLSNDRERVDLLLADAPDLGHERNMFGVSAIHAAHFTGRPAMVAMLRRSDSGDAFALAVELGDADAVEAALAADPGLATTFDGAGGTALHGACYWGQFATAEILVRSGADVTVPTRDSFLRIAPLGSAVAGTPGVAQPSDSEEVVLALVRLLLDHGADPTHTRADGMTALHTAAFRGHAEVARALLSAGADPRAAAASGPHAGETPDQSALSQGHLVLASQLDRV